MTTATPRRPIGTEPIEQPRRRRLPRLRVPHVRLPDVHLPDVRLPDVRLPDVRLPDVRLPDVRLPDVRLRGAPAIEPGGMHPRMQRRRREVADVHRRRRTRRLGALFAVALVLAGAVGALWSPLLDVDEVVVAGAPGPSADLVRRAAGVSLGTPLVGVDPAVVRRRVEALDWVAHARVERRWPGELVLDVLAERPVALVAEGEGPPRWVATSSGRVVRASRMTPVLGAAGSGPRVLHVPAGSRDDPEVALAVGFLGSLGPASGAHLGEANLSGGTLTFTSNPAPLDRATVVVGDLRDRPRKIQALEAALLDGSVDLRCVTHLDVSVPTRFTMMRSQGCPS